MLPWLLEWFTLGIVWETPRFVPSKKFQIFICCVYEVWCLHCWWFIVLAGVMCSDGVVIIGSHSNFFWIVFSVLCQSEHAHSCTYVVHACVKLRLWHLCCKVHVLTTCWSSYSHTSMFEYVHRQLLKCILYLSECKMAPFMSLNFQENTCI